MPGNAGMKVSTYATPAIARVPLPAAPFFLPTYPLHDDSAQRMADEDERPLRGAFDLRRHTAPLAVWILFCSTKKMDILESQGERGHRPRDLPPAAPRASAHAA